MSGMNRVSLAQPARRLLPLWGLCAALAWGQGCSCTTDPIVEPEPEPGAGPGVNPEPAPGVNPEPAPAPGLNRPPATGNSKIPANSRKQSFLATIRRIRGNPPVSILITYVKLRSQCCNATMET